MILALDISTSVVGLALFGLENDNYKLHELSYKKFKPKNNLFEKVDEFDNSSYGLPCALYILGRLYNGSKDILSKNKL